VRASAAPPAILVAAASTAAFTCYARPFHEYLGCSAGLDFESKIMVKENAQQLLRAELSSPKWKPKPIAMSGVTGCYQPVERRLQLTRGCLQVMAEFRNPVGIVTKNFTVTREADLLGELPRWSPTWRPPRPCAWRNVGGRGPRASSRSFGTVNWSRRSTSKRLAVMRHHPFACPRSVTRVGDGAPLSLGGVRSIGFSVDTSR
jgi:hypothetical protein